MADAKDVAAVIQSALDEIGVTGQLDVSMDGQEASKVLGTPTGNDQRVEVVVEDLETVAIKQVQSGRSCVASHR